MHYAIIYTLQISKVQLGSTKIVSQFPRRVENYRTECVILWLTSLNVVFAVRNRREICISNILYLPAMTSSDPM